MKRYKVIVSPFAADNIRQALYGRGTPWRIFFTVDGETVQVLHVRHGNRDYWRP
jgi:hypothetical protein